MFKLRYFQTHFYWFFLFAKYGILLQEEYLCKNKVRIKIILTLSLLYIAN
jgi:hypothetical protein